MRIQQLNFTAFGPFTDRVLVFAQQQGGLHIVYGPNEAGKSSALRGLKALLYGIETRTLDNFLHPNDKLRIHGCLRNTDGHELVFVRRKGRKNTLLTLEGDILDEQKLAPFLQGVTAEFFETLFGIDHQGLVQGGQEILEQKGEVGQALFSAALGSHTLHAVLGQLDDEADGLFRPRGSTQTINAALKSHTELSKEIKDRSLSSREWDEHRRALGRTTKALAQIQSELASNRIEVNRLKRIQRVLPKLARRHDLLKELESLSMVIILADNFGERRQNAVKKLETAQAIINKTSPRLEALQQQREGLSINQGLLDQAENIEGLHARLGGHRKALQDRPHLEAQRQQLLTDAEFSLKDVQPGYQLTDIEKLRPVIAKQQSITELGNNNAVLISRLAQAESNRRKTEMRLKGARREGDELPKTGSSAPLRRTLAAARKLGDMDAVIQSTQSELTTLEVECAANLSRLTLWDGVLEDLPGLMAPNRESIIHFEAVYDQHEKHFQRLQEKQEEAANELQNTSLRLDEIQRVGMVPTETDLMEVRSHRDQIWQLLRRQWIDGENVSDQVSDLEIDAVLADTFEKRLTDADELSDRLRREADRVHKMASLYAKQESLQQQIVDITQQLEASTTEKVRITDDWQALWAPCQIQPRTPREMRVWLDDLENLRARVRQLNLLRQKTSEMEQTRKTHIQHLNQQLKTLGKGGSKSEILETVLSECEGFAQQLDQTKQQRDRLVNEVSELEVQLESLTDEHRLAGEQLEAWKVQWQALIESFGLQGEASPAEISAIIEKLRELFSQQSEAEKLQIRIKAIDNDAASFRQQVAKMSATIAPELADLSADDATIRFNSMLSDNRSRNTRRRQIEQQIEQAMQDIQDSEATIQSMSERLSKLCVEAKCDNPADLEVAERKSAQHLKIKAAIDAIEQEILETGEGAIVADLEVEAEAIEPDVLPVRIEQLSNEINDELEPKRTDLAEAKGREEKELELMDGSDHAAALANQAQANLAGIRSDAERYVRVKLASRLLRDQIERYRKDNQGPLVRRASEHFAVLTRGSFEGLRTDFNEKDEPILAGIRPDGDSVYVEGMSSGTRDQLYLSLRLASLEKYMETAEPMPFIVDDVLVDFDDDRSQAALNVLLVLAEKTQVILFTHHSQVVEQANRLDGAAQVQVHQL